MTKTWLANFISFKSKHPKGATNQRVVVQAKYKKDAIQLAKKELELFDKEHHDKYRVPLLAQIHDQEEAQNVMMQYLAARERATQTNPTPAEELEDTTSEITAKVATMAEFPIIAPYTVQLVVAKNGDSFIHSMAIINHQKGGNIVGQNDVFNPKPFSTIDAAVIYGLAMAIDAIHAHLTRFLKPEQIDKSVKILSDYAHDAEGNFIERYVSDFDMSNASLMPVNVAKPNADMKDVDQIIGAITEHPSVVRTFGGAAKDWINKRVRDNWINLHNKYGQLPAAKIIQHMVELDDVTSFEALESCDELVSYYVKNTTTETVKELMPPAKANPKETCQVGRSVLKSLSRCAKRDDRVTNDQLQIIVSNLREIFSELSKEHGVNFLYGYSVVKMENEPWESFNIAIDTFISKKKLDAIFRKNWLCLTSEASKKGADKEQFNVPPQLRHYIDEIMTQFIEPETPLPTDKLTKAAQNIGKLFNTWKVSLFGERDQYTIDADMFKDEIFLFFDNNAAADALDFLCSEIGTESKLIDVLCSSFDECIDDLDPEVKKLILELIHRLEVDSSLECTFTTDVIKALIYSELNATDADAIKNTLLDPAKTLRWWNHLATDYCAGKRGTAQYQTIVAEDANQSAAQFEKEISAIGSGEPTPEKYGERLLNMTNENTPPFEQLVAVCLQSIDDSHYHFQATDYKEAGKNLEHAFNQVAAAAGSNIDATLTIKNLRNTDWDSGESAMTIFLDKNRTFDLVAECAEFEQVEEKNDPYIQKLEPEHPQNEPELTTQCFEPFYDDSPAYDVNPSPDATQPQEMTVRELLQKQMRTAKQKIGLAGVAWGYQVKRHWLEDNKHDHTNCHCEIGIWFRDENGGKVEPLTFFGTSNANAGNYINDAMILALVDGLSLVFAVLNLEIEYD